MEKVTKMTEHLRKLDYDSCNLTEVYLDLCGYYGITNTNRLVSMGCIESPFHEDDLRRWGKLSKDEKIVKEIEFNPPIGSHYNPKHTTDWARAFWEEKHPESDFDKMFETDEPGVFERFQGEDGFYEWRHDKQLRLLTQELNELGYSLDVQIRWLLTKVEK